MRKDINKDILASIIYEKLDHQYSISEIISVIVILIDEMANDLINGGKFYINNFGKFVLKRLPPRKYFNYQTNKVEQSVGNKVLRFVLSENLKRKILNNIDLTKTFDK